MVSGHFARRWAGMGSGERLRFIAALERGPGGAREAVPADGLRAPLVEEDPANDPSLALATFLFWDPASSAVVLSANSLIGAETVAAYEFEQLPASALWALTLRMPAGWEAGYRISTHRGPGLAPWRAVTGRRAVRLAADAGGPDPLNPVLVAGMNGSPSSVVRLPSAPPAPWLAPPTPSAGAGSPAMGGVPAPVSPSPGSAAPVAVAPVSPRLERCELWDAACGRWRENWIYAPPGNASEPTPLVILHDGQVWARYQSLAATLDAAIAEGALPAVHVAMVDSLDADTRWKELGGPEGTVDFVATSLVPQLRHHLPVSPRPADTIASGASFGGLAALWQVARYPDVVATALAQSPSLWRYDLSGPLAAVIDRTTIRMQAGLYETGIIDNSRLLLEALAPLGADIELSEVPGGHDWAWWTPWLIHGLAGLLARP